MTAKEMWSEYARREDIEDIDHDVWAFGDQADKLAALVAGGKKTATASAYPLYELEGEPLPREGEYSVILDSREQAVCIIRTERVYVTPFREVSEEHARREGEGDLSLAFWRKAHERFFRQEMEEAGSSFDEEMQVVCEEFACVYAPGGIGVRIRAKLWEMQDAGYRDFHSKLIPTVPPESIIGVRTPQVRKYAVQLAKEPDIGDFLAQLPHRYYDENNVHAFVLERIGDYQECLAQTERFLPYVDNWATCDMMAPKVFAGHKAELLEPIGRWISSGDTYTVRFGVGMLMRHYLDEDFKPEYPQWVAAIRSEEYYVNMMRAWYFATALPKQYESILPYFQERRLDDWTHNKAIQKACESYRVTAEQKKYLRSLKVQAKETRETR